MGSYHGFQYDFEEGRRELQPFYLDETSVVERRHMGWAFAFLSAGIGEIMTGAALAAEQSSTCLGLFAASSIALVLSFRKARHYSNELDIMSAI